jgi:hypothetical protein
MCLLFQLLKSIGKSIMLNAKPGKNARSYIKKENLKQKWMGIWFKWYSTCLASVRP